MENTVNDVCVMHHPPVESIEMDNPFDNMEATLKKYITLCASGILSY
jgi:hypothetical protein